MKIALIGGHGKIALLLEPLLVAAGHEVSAVIRNPKQTTDVEATGARAVVADIETLDAHDWDELLTGHDAVIWSAGGGGNADRTRAVDLDAAIASIDAAGRAGIGRYVMVSYFGAGLDHGVPQDDAFHAYAESKARADAHLRESGLTWTILGPSTLTLEPAGGIELNRDGSVDGGSVSRETVAHVAAAAVEDERTYGRMLEFNDGETSIEKAFDDLP